MTLEHGQGGDSAEALPSRRGFRNGTLLIIGLLVFLLVGWVFYRQTLPPEWLRDFSAAVARHAAADPNPLPPEDIRQVAPPVNVESPYICAGRVVDLPWDRMFVVTSAAELRRNAALTGAVWPAESIEFYTDLLSRDDRYQLIVLMRREQVVDAQLYYTFWGDLSAINRPGGFLRAEAIFTAKSRGSIYILSPAVAPPETCL